jgi:hypothetical protein
MELQLGVAPLVGQTWEPRQETSTIRKSEHTSRKHEWRK